MPLKGLVRPRQVPSGINGFRLPTVSGPYAANLLRQGDVVNRAGGLARGKDQHAEGYADDDEEREEKFKKGFGKKLVHRFVHSNTNKKPPRLCGAALAA